MKQIEDKQSHAANLAARKYCSRNLYEDAWFPVDCIEIVDRLIYMAYRAGWMTGRRDAVVLLLGKRGEAGLLSSCWEQESEYERSNVSS